MTITRLLAAALVCFAAAACGSVTDPSQNVPETFTGSVQPNNVGPVHQFNISNSGELTVVVTSIVPGSTFLGIQYGQLVNNGCGVLQQNAVSSANLGRTVITAQLTNKGTYCVQAFDPVNLGLAGLVVGQNYTLTVNHP